MAGPPAITNLQVLPGGTCRLSFSGTPGWRYHLQVTDSLLSPAWRSALSFPLSGSSGEFTWAMHEAQEFFRLWEQPVPTNHLARYLDIEFNLRVFSNAVGQLPWRVATPQTKLGLPSMYSNGNRGWSLLTATNRARMLAEVDCYHELGIQVLKLDITYPLLTAAFHQNLANQPGYGWYAGIGVTNYLEVYSQLVARARSYGMRILVEHSSLIPSYAVMDPAFYYDEIRALGAALGRQRYRAERGAECQIIMDRLQPDYFSIVLEPDAQNTHFGNFGQQPLMFPAEWQSYVEDTATAIRTGYSSNEVALGAGLGTWEASTYKDLFRDVDALDYIDFHIYPLADTNRHFLTNMLTWCADVIGAGKSVSIGEAWLYKASAADMAGGNAFHDEVYARDLYSFWEPLDAGFVQATVECARKENMLFLAFFWPNYLFGYKNYTTDFVLGPGETPDDLPPSVRLNIADSILSEAVFQEHPHFTEPARVLLRHLQNGAAANMR
jgi:hypothetical protein